ncbi:MULTISPECIES: 5-formyltetrahydrofolate cyclo-ligase [unclassified Campylobacter]|uniref:5-formyltetrahydrofolate cyclo-ligase n=1 Tax=unclassified Campylobacter TaxID=2593542 RepID=UPI001237DE19|nr:MULTISPECIES: 5-formyltetrahydrofolate cyclo-ligase [unclassified Campylobacter]KAA6226677.1 5-formyltetrahydrofolate cyclo-ligase [Campylobacter sp. LR286c]KAA6227693.1 5-formyltetrahydrofolate cyclo-ligase [Campylobacter sp. LR196d]KAA6227709.1 5-formyltetrahydrofolate cyclo-ligase [Campylobacter sp. LR185c]KAA6231240.1 5-formyltetrahydrofolate cyclo-ligase [Campylobacter sp. LR291e]KAA6234129.1 5-formyltetrahydrofolate cyclo-ligase [Campylobacter sp. LR264d]
MQKDEFRTLQKQRLKNQVDFKFRQDFKVFKECLFLIKKFKAKRILLYCSLKYEPNLLRFRQKLSRHCKIFVPFMNDISFKIVKLRLPLSQKRFKVLEPNNSFLNTSIDLAIVPVIGVDKTLRRIGHGHGFYDRFFENVGENFVIIFTQSINSLSDEFVCEKHDVQGGFYINPYKKYYRKGNDNRTYHSCSYRRCFGRRSRLFNSKKNQRRKISNFCRTS